jgi:hypothetical protein
MLCVPQVSARGPRQVLRKGGDEEPEGPGDDDVVVEVDVKGDQHHRIPDSCAQRKLNFHPQTNKCASFSSGHGAIAHRGRKTKVASGRKAAGDTRGKERTEKGRALVRKIAALGAGERAESGNGHHFPFIQQKKCRARSHMHIQESGGERRARAIAT